VAQEEDPPLRVLQEQLYEWRNLLQSNGWKQLVGFAKTQVDQRVHNLVLNAETEGTKLHYARGECAGIQLFSQIPQIEIDRLEAEIASINIPEKDNES
jgi:hypothetical protein